jgi:hypothetical protein
VRKPVENGEAITEVRKGRKGNLNGLKFFLSDLGELLL